MATFFIRKSSFSGEILHNVCIFNGRFKGKVAIKCVIRSTLSPRRPPHTHHRIIFRGFWQGEIACGSRRLRAVPVQHHSRRSARCMDGGLPRKHKITSKYTPFYPIFASFLHSILAPLLLYRVFLLHFNVFLLYFYSILAPRFPLCCKQKRPPPQQSPRGVYLIIDLIIDLHRQRPR